MKKFFALVVLAFLFGNVQNAVGDDQSTIRVLFPAYQNPVGPGGPLMWSTLIADANNPNVELNVIFNPANGPGNSAEANYYNDSGTGAIQQLKATDAVIFGYVFTGFGERDLSEVQADVAAYGVHYPGIIEGIFVDEVDNDLASTGYYQDLRDFIAIELPGVPVIGNPGQSFIINESGQTQFEVTDYLNAFDTVVSFENFGDVYFNGYAQNQIPLSLDPSRICHLVHTQSSWDPSHLELVHSRGAEYLYFTDDMFVPGVSTNPFDALPGYWNEFVADVEQFNTRSGYFAPGNMNGDDAVNLLDVGLFVLAVGSGEYRLQADINCDGSVNLLDVDPFIDVLSGN